jgi:hypothetical protein
VLQTAITSTIIVYPLYISVAIVTLNEEFTLHIACLVYILRDSQLPMTLRIYLNNWIKLIQIYVNIVVSMPYQLADRWSTNIEHFTVVGGDD